MSLKLPLLALPLALAGCKEPLVVESYLALVHLSPPSGAADVNVDAMVVATFSEPLVGASIDAQTAWVEDVDQVPVVATVTYDGSNNSIIVVPETALAPVTTYRIFLTDKIKGANSGALGAAITSDFTTGGWEPSNQLPVADAGDDAAGRVGEPIQLDGSGSMDPEGAMLTYSWRLVSVPPGSSIDLEEAITPAAQFTPDVIGEYVAGLIVNDGIEDSSEDFVLARVAPATGSADTGTADTGTTDPGTSDTGEPSADTGVTDTGG